uniref:Uncharacterized protein n=1 Tax=Pseudomonas putida TaxID=303 RepID=A0A0N9MHJ1_PSEPU|nr:hypothetical protein [Pseudomonas putida]
MTMSYSDMVWWLAE